MSRRPVVGVCAALEQARWTVWDVEANVSPTTYSREVAAAGAQTVILPTDAASSGAPDEVLDLLDALLLAGGGDLDPASYGAERDERTGGVRPERDRFELALASRAIERELPVLGICRGMEILNVARGGTLDQHLPSAEAHLHTPGTFTDHEVQLEPGSLASRAVGSELISVHSHHHQGIGELGEGLAVSGRSAGDEVIEAVELSGHPFCLGILWHAEEEEGSEAIGSLVAAARAAVAA